MATTPTTIFYSYSHRDEAFKEQLEIRLALLRRKGLIKTWHDRRIIPGQEWETAIENHLDEADIILLLVSADFIASDYCFGKEVVRAMERHERNEAKVIPIVVRAVDWSDAPFGRLQALPKDAHPVTSWNNQDEAWLDVEKGIKKAIEELQDIKYRDRPRPPSWWKFVSSVSMPEKFLPQLPYNERSQSDQGLGIPLKQPSTASLVLDLSIHRFVAGGSDH